MHPVATAFSVFLILAILWEAFETVVLPRRIGRKLRFTRYFYLITWTPWRAVSLWFSKPNRRETFLSFYGPLSLVVLFATWAVLLVCAFALLQWGMGSQLRSASGGAITFASDLYLSGTTLFTLGLGDMTPLTRGARLAVVAESAIGFGFIALIVSYLPTVYQAFARREVRLSLLDARAGSPPTASEFLHRYASNRDPASIVPFLAESEYWASELLESHLSYPALCYFRSQHSRQSWISGLTTTLDVCAIIETCGTAEQRWQAKLTFFTARRAVIDLSRVFHLQPSTDRPDRLAPGGMEILRRRLAEDRIVLPETERLNELRAEYEPYVDVLARFLAMDVAPWIGPAALQ